MSDEEMPELEDFSHQLGKVKGKLWDLIKKVK